MFTDRKTHCCEDVSFAGWPYRRSRAFQEVLVVKNLLANAGDAGSVPGLGKSPGGGRGNPL